MPRGTELASLFFTSDTMPAMAETTCKVDGRDVGYEEAMDAEHDCLHKKDKSR